MASTGKGSVGIHELAVVGFDEATFLLYQTNPPHGHRAAMIRVARRLLVKRCAPR
jgi:hypothetical protein